MLHILMHEINCILKICIYNIQCQNIVKIDFLQFVKYTNAIRI